MVRSMGSHMRLTGVVSNEHLWRANRCSQDGKSQGRRYQIASSRNYDSRSAGKRGSTLKGRALYDKLDWIAHKILAQ